MPHATAHPEDCFICRKYSGREKQPPDGIIYEGHHFLLCHAPLRMGTSGTLIVESKRHFLDYEKIKRAEGAELFEMKRRSIRWARIQALDESMRPQSDWSMRFSSYRQYCGADHAREYLFALIGGRKNK